MKKVYCIICLLILTVIVIESPFFSNNTAEAEIFAAETMEIDIDIEISCYELYVYNKQNEDLMKSFDEYLENNKYTFTKKQKETNSSVYLYTLTDMDTSTAFSVYKQANNIIKEKNENAVINLSSRGSVNEEQNLIQIAKAVYEQMHFTPQNMLKSNNFFEADGLGYIGTDKQEMQIVVRACQGSGFCEFIIGIPSVLNEY